MAGGEWPDQNPNETFWQFNSILDEWNESSSLLTPRSELGNLNFFQENTDNFYYMLF